MAFFLHTHSWNFPSNNYGQIFGIADSGVETFKGTPMKSLAREICQNSIDANLGNGQPTRVEFVPFEINVSDVPGVADLKDAFSRSYDFWERQQSTKAKKFFKDATAAANKKTIECLRISDFNTSGLTGSDEEYNSPWCNLTKSTGASDKGSTNGGSFGIGKFAPYACSSFRTVFYSTSDKYGKQAYQGVARLTSFKNKKGDITQGTGFYGNDKNAPVKGQISLDPTYSRTLEESGTDIFIVGFNGEKEWKSKMVASILDGFLYAIYSGDLIVNVAGVEISKETLPELMVSYKPYFEEYADEYYTALISDEKVSPVFVKEIEEPGMRGTITLRLMIMPDLHRRVAMVRQTGMKIKNKGNINGLIPFTGLLFIEGDELNGYLRNLENPQHLEWEIERADNKSQARKLLSTFTKFIKEKLDELKNDDSEEALDPSVGEYLSAEEDKEKEDDKTEGIKDNIKNIDLRKTKTKPVTPTAISEENGNTAVDDPNGEIIVDDVPGEGGRDGDAPGGQGTGGGGHDVGPGGGDTPVEHRKTLKAITSLKSRVVCKDKDNGKYAVTFVPSADASNGIIDLYLVAESQSYEAPIIAASCDEYPEMRVKGNRIIGISFKKNSAVRINVELDYNDYCSMEVKAYGNKE